MAKASGSKRASSKALPDTAGKAIKADSGPAGEGSFRTWINERGETCIGTKCFSFAINERTKDVTVKVDRKECDADLQPVLDTIFEAIGKGGRTLYESTSLVSED